MIRLFAWQPDRHPRFARFVGTPLTATGDELLVCDGIALPPACEPLRIKKPARGVLGDFLYDIGLQLFVSPVAAALIRTAHTPAISFHRVDVVDSHDRLLGEYQWLNVQRTVPLLDRARASFREGSAGCIWSVDSFVVDPACIPSDDLFITDCSIRVFSERLVSALQEAGLSGALFTLLEGSSWPLSPSPVPSVSGREA